MCSTLNMMVEVASPCEFFLQNETYAPSTKNRKIRVVFGDKPS